MSTDLERKIKEKFKHLSNQQLIARANLAPDFGWDDEGVELDRRRRTSNGHFDYEMEGNRLVIKRSKEEKI